MSNDIVQLEDRVIGFIAMKARRTGITMVRDLLYFIPDAEITEDAEFEIIEPCACVSDEDRASCTNAACPNRPKLIRSSKQLTNGTSNTDIPDSL